MTTKTTPIPKYQPPTEFPERPAGNPVGYEIPLFEGGTRQCVADVGELVLPDLWHVAEGIRNGDIQKDKRDLAAAMVLETWHIAGWMLNHLRKLGEIGAMLQDRGQGPERKGK